MTKTRSKVHIIGIAAAVISIVLAVWLLGRLMQPKYASGVLEGAMTAEY